MSFQDELRRNMRTSGGIECDQAQHAQTAIEREAYLMMDSIRQGLICSARNADYIVCGDLAITSYIHPISQRFICKQRMDNGNQITANSKRGFFRDRSLTYRVWYSFQLEPKWEKEYVSLRQALNGLAAKDGIRLDYILHDNRTGKDYSFPTQIDGFQLASDFVLAVKATISTTL